MSTAREPNPLAGRRLHAMRLSVDVTYDLFLGSRVPKRWALLSKNGDYMRVQEPGLEPEVLQYTSWDDAARGADANGTNFVAVMHERRVVFRATDTAGPYEWWPAIVIPDDSILTINNAQADRYEPDAQGKQPKKKRPSGAQNRKRKR